jgi:ATP-dependent helicase YprA (DUF1998 family)
MTTNSSFTTQEIFARLQSTLHGYLEAQYHIWDASLIRERRRLIQNAGTTYSLPFYEATPTYLAYEGNYDSLKISPEARDALTKFSKVPKSPIFSRPFRHQGRAIELFVGKDKADQREVIVATGTGSGKTESFLLPLLASLVLEAKQRPDTAKDAGVRALLLYPMNALVNDQLTRLRRILGNKEIAAILAEGRDRPVRFGMYTSRAPYPGMREQVLSRESKRLLPKIQHLLDASPEVRDALLNEGMWPAKDISAFVQNGFNGGPNDIELFTRHEIHETPPDILVTNYSMLEYMLIRPIERQIFSKTSQWLHSDPNNCLTVILDEAHMYRGAAGAEVALLLRRLQSRLEIDRSRIRYILTSASLGEGDEAVSKVKEFAAELTGHTHGMLPFEVITGEKDFPPKSGPADQSIASALAVFERELLELGKFEINRAECIKNLNKLMKTLGLQLVDAHDVGGLRDQLFDRLMQLPVAGLLAREITSNPRTLPDVADVLFPACKQSEDAVETLMALCCFAQRESDKRVFLPVRMHLFFRGLGGLYACINPYCTERQDSSFDSYELGRLYDEPRLRCPCGARVFELLTHRDCGAAFIRGYMRGEAGNFLWHEPGVSLSDSGPALLETHLLVQDPSEIPDEGRECWLHISTGQVIGDSPSEGHKKDFLRVYRPDHPIQIRGQNILSFDSECPVCRQKWQKRNTKIMDLATKGDAPFAHLIKTQVQSQPATKEKTQRFPNAGRKSLIFSDGRQKAARLARDIPREVEQDVFRQVLMLAVQDAEKTGRKELKCDEQLFTSFVHVLSRLNLRLFDGEDRVALDSAIGSYQREHGSNLSEAIDEPWRYRAPNSYTQGILRHLGSRFYSISALTLGYVAPTSASVSRLTQSLGIDKQDECQSICVVWLQHALGDMAFDASLPSRVRSLAFGVNRRAEEWGLSKQNAVPDNRKLDQRIRGIERLFGRARAQEIDSALIDVLCEQKDNVHFVRPSKVRVVPALNSKWYRCRKCTWLSPKTISGVCVQCASNLVDELDPQSSDYLRARKYFWRDPVAKILFEDEVPFTIDVQEHTAQLGYVDKDEPSSTTEQYERRFRDILSSSNETAIDVLSSTTTMEVGVDIGSLVSVGLRNVPPMRQNYQQRAGRAGRRGASVSTVITYAQNGSHDAYYFSKPIEIISGQPPLPSIDVDNPRIVIRHIYAAIIQAFFHANLPTASKSGNLFSVLGKATDFFAESGHFNLKSLTDWIASTLGKECLKIIQMWIPVGSGLSAASAAVALLESLRRNRPEDNDESDFLEFLFARGILPTYAFPRALCALHIEKLEQTQIKIVQRPQQALGIALTEYSPGRLVVVDKKTYRIGAITANIPSLEDRAAPLFAPGKIKAYRHCVYCGHTEEPDEREASAITCRLCKTTQLREVEVIQPEVVYPEDRSEVDEFDDEPVFTYSTAAQFPFPTEDEKFKWDALSKVARCVIASNQSLIMVNKGLKQGDTYSGFDVCALCGRTPPPGEMFQSPHERNYFVKKFGGVGSRKCNGQSRNVYLGFNFRTDLFLIRVKLEAPIIQEIEHQHHRKPLENALNSLAEALSLAACLELDIDPRELGTGIRFISTLDGPMADIYLHDTASGGAGYSQMAGKIIEKVFDRAYQLLTECKCETSCRKCLRHYGNRMVHADLDRRLAIDAWKYVRNGKLPAIEAHDMQVRVLKPLRQMLELAGIKCKSSEQSPLIVLGSRTSLNIGCYPSILQKDLSGHPLQGSGAIFCNYEIEKNLPWVYSSVCGLLK